MKKFFIFLFSITVLAACSSDDDNAADGPDPILGTWVMVDATFVSPEACDQESFITFNQDNTATGVFYLGETECSAQSSDGEWQNLGNSLYTVAIPFAGNVQGTATFSNDGFIFATQSYGSFTFQKQ